MQTRPVNKLMYFFSGGKTEPSRVTCFWSVYRQSVAPAVGVFKNGFIIKRSKSGAQKLNDSKLVTLSAMTGNKHYFFRTAGFVDPHVFNKCACQSINKAEFNWVSQSVCLTQLR